MSQLSFTVDTNDARTVREVAETLLRLSGQPALPVAPSESEDWVKRAEAFQSTTSQIEDEGVTSRPEDNPIFNVFPDELKHVYAPELDSEGQPWDERIHSSSRSKIANGTWKLKRGVSDELVAQVRGTGFTPSNGSENTPPPPVEPTAESTPPPPPPPPPAAPGMSYAELITKVTTNGTPILKLQEACQAEGVESFPLLAKHADKVAAVAARLGIA